jgi:type I restriction enzyme R subunit
MTLLAESDVESAPLAWLEALGWAVKHGDEIAPDGTSTERRDFS